MILDTLDRLPRYFPLHPGFELAHWQLTQMLASPPAPSRYVVEEDRLFTIVAQDQGRGCDASPLEFHRRYIDIQLVLDEYDYMGWKPLDECQTISQPYDGTRDIGFYADRPATWVHVPRGSFVVFFPEDAHAPLATAGSVTKAVAKIAVKW
ncbi:MAG: YhcH/YjgK/YiaL family protein [Planctomycetales bacterium]|nr:YhcH/YjgK/YiaL family protein [Planctomycetales bacterium]